MLYEVITSGHGLILEMWPKAEKVTVPRSRVMDIDTEDDYRRLLELEPGES